MERIIELKAEGNQLYKQGSNKDAVDAYTRALSLLDVHASQTPPSMKLRATLLSNTSLCRCLMKEYGGAITAALHAIMADPTYTKSYGRLATAYLYDGQYAEVRVCEWKRIDAHVV